MNRPADALRDPHIAFRGTVVPTSAGRAVRPPFLSQVPELRAAPEVGQDTDEVLRTL